MTESEFRAYPYIEKVLKGLGWDIRHPKRGGFVYTQGEFRDHDARLNETLRLKAPENTVIVPWDGGPRYWIVEAKAAHSDLEVAVSEARDYAELVNGGDPMPDGVGPARFITGIAGTPDESFFVTTEFWNGQRWTEVAINDYETTGFLSLDQCQRILDRNNAHVAVFDDDPDRFLDKANAINKTLQRHEIPVGDRARIIAALLLALAQDGNLRIHAEPTALMREINGLIEDLLHKHGKQDFTKVIALTLPATKKNHRKFRQAIIDTMQHLREMNIRSAINGTDDALGKFYETFLKYANGAKEMGIVLTPRHITKFAADVVGIGPDDRVFDPACGTGGFLISAMESMRQHDAYTEFLDNGVHGIEQRDDVYGLAIVNMIFRGDGKSHVYDGNCFDHQFWERDDKIWYTLDDDSTPQGAERPFNRAFMNPPFKLDDSPETRFVNYALGQLQRSGIMFVILPYVAVGGSRNQEWRRQLLRRHTLLASVQLDKNLFYPVAEATYALIVRAHEPHPNEQKVFMGRLFDDDHRPRRSKMLSDHVAVDNLERMTAELRRFMLGQPVENSLPREQAVITINEEADFSPEGYLPNKSVQINPATRSIGTSTARLMVSSRHLNLKPVPRTAVFPLTRFVSSVEDARVETIKAHPKGSVPLVSATADNNGIADWLDIPDDMCNDHCITVSLLHNTKPCQAFWHPYKFGALLGKVMVLKPNDDLLDEPDAIIYLCEAITACNAWRYHYARGPRYEDLEVEAPSRYRRPDIIKMARIVTDLSQPGLTT
ncbi:MAG: N-6 DNA methylase [Acidimicrobiaceae bacterium]|nr:N-6 DNA methylase [Acidimicrobiaceae bacterium]MYI36928.1 N-6 DNA methylase [Acidimicrobiaceae bacterium]